MGKASRRRKKRRLEYLGRLARENPRKFQSEWAKRLASWSREANRRAGRLTGDGDASDQTAFALVDEALDVLSGCGPKAVDLEGADTKDVMTDSCCWAVAKAVDRRMYRLRQYLVKLPPHGRKNQM